MSLILVRHGQTEWNVSNRAQGHVDIGLDETGLAQAELLSTRLHSFGIERILSSDLGRCLQTVQPLVDRIGLEPEPRFDLRERTFGDREGDSFTGLHDWMREEARLLGVPEWEIRPPGGESMVDVWNRLEAVEHELRAERKNVLVVSHGGALAQLLTRLIRGTTETARAFRFDNCSVTVLLPRPDGSLWLNKMNDSRHLEALREVSRVR